MQKYVLGLDIGITSVGWGLIDIATNKIVDKGVRLFSEGTASNNVKRRAHRGSRRLKRRRQQRIIDFKKILIENKIVNEQFKPLSNPYEIRVKGLTTELTNEEFATAMLHLIKRRGSCLDVVEDNDDKQKEVLSTKEILKNNEKLLKEKGYYICQLQYERLINNGSVRGTENNFKTYHYVEEADAILANQNVSDDLKKQIIELIRRKREYYEGPGSKKSPTKYGRYFYDENGEIKYVEMIEKMRGKCSIFPNEPCSPKMSYTADLFNFLNDLNNLDVDGESISKEQKEEIIQQFINKKGEINPQTLCKYLGVDEALVSGFRVDANDKSLLTPFKGYKKILNVVNNKKMPLNKEIIENKEYVDKVLEILTRVKGKDDRIKEIQNINGDVFFEETAKKLANISGVTGYHSLSKKAMDMIIPELLDTSDNQMQILSKNGLLHKGKIENLKGLKNIPFDDEEILSPVAKRAQNEAIKVVNAIRCQYGELESIIIETARDKNSEEERLRISKEKKRGEELNKRCEEIAKNIKLNTKLRHKIRLYMEQDGKCLYSGKSIDLNLLLNDPHAYEIDHVIPISISFDDSMNNKVLVLSKYNHSKGNMTPFKFLKSRKLQGWSYEEYKGYVINLKKNNKISKKKLLNLIFEEEIDKFSVRKKFIERNLVDTRYTSRVILNTLYNYFKANSIDTKVHTVRGSLTSIFRKKAELVKNRDYFYHHIVDALIIAGIKKQDYLNKLLNLQKPNFIIDEETGEVIYTVNEQEFFDSNYLNYISQLKELDNCVNFDGTHKISHKVDRKPNRQFTDETIYGVRQRDGVDWRIGRYKDIYGNDGEKLAKDILEGKDDKILMSKVDPLTYELLKKIVKHTVLDSEKGEKNPFAKYKDEHGYIRKVSKKNNGPIIKSVKYYFEKLGNHVDVTHKYVNDTNDVKVVLLQVKPYRTDFYKTKEGIYKFITIRYANISIHNNEYYIDRNWYEQELLRKEINNSFNFMFSLYRNEYIEITKQEKEYNETKLYRFVGTNNDLTNVIEVKPLHCNKENDKPQIMISIGKKILNINKYHSDVLGNLYKVEKELLHLRL